MEKAEHGPSECLLNTIEACAINAWPKLGFGYSQLEYWLNLRVFLTIGMVGIVYWMALCCGGGRELVREEQKGLDHGDMECAHVGWEHLRLFDCFKPVAVRIGLVTCCSWPHHCCHGLVCVRLVARQPSLCWDIHGATYAFCLFFAKLVAYTFLYWLPFYISYTVVRFLVGGVFSVDDSAASIFNGQRHNREVAEEELSYRVCHKLVEVHSEKYLKSLKRSSTVAKITEVSPVAMIPNFMSRFCWKPWLMSSGGCWCRRTRASFRHVIWVSRGETHQSSSSSVRSKGEAKRLVFLDEIALSADG